jgi:hypothetical protein
MDRIISIGEISFLSTRLVVNLCSNGSHIRVEFKLVSEGEAEAAFNILAERHFEV